LFVASQLYPGYSAEQVYGHKYISYDILIVDTEEVTAYISIKLISQRR